MGMKFNSKCIGDLHSYVLPRISFLALSAMPLTSQNRFLRWLPPGIWGIIILILSLMPGGPGNLNLFGIPYFDKIGHFGMYAVWTFLFFRALSSGASMSLKKAFWMTLIIGTLTGVVLEYGQYFMAQGRSFELADMAANALGALIGSEVGYFYFLRKTR